MYPENAVLTNPDILNNNVSNQIAIGTRGILKNVVLISVSFTLLFTAVTISNLQSSINYEEGLGVYTLATMYAALVVSCLFSPTYFVQTFGAKGTILLSMVVCTIYVAVQFYPKFWTMVPVGILTGFASGPLWSAKCTYLTRVGIEYSKQGENQDVVIVRFFSIFFTIFQSSQIWGNLISSTVLSFGDDANRTKDISVCGADFCPSDAQGGVVLQKPEDWKIYFVAGIFMSCALAAIFILELFVDPLTCYGREENDEGSTLTSSTTHKTLATFRQMKNPYQLLLIPITFWSGLQQAFLGSDFTQAYITCGWGVENVGYVLISYGIYNSIGSAGFGALMKYTGRLPIFTFATILNGCAIAGLFFWKPSSASPIVFFVIAGVWGLADSIWQTQINALYGVIFAKVEEAAFSNYRLWESLGFIVAYLNTNNVCVHVRLYTLIGTLVPGMICYLIAEYLIRRTSRIRTIKYM